MSDDNIAFLQDEIAALGRYIEALDSHIDEQSTRIAALEAALKPFADRADQHLEGAHWMDACFTVDDCRAARVAMENKDD